MNAQTPYQTKRPFTPVEPEFPPFEPTESFDQDAEETFDADERTFVEILAADKKTVAARKKASAFAAAFNAVMRRAGVIEACAKLEINANEIQRLYLTLVDAAQRTEHFAEESGAACSKNRRFKASGFTMEMFYKRELMPRNLDKEKEMRWMNSRGRMWRKRWARVHKLQRHLHLAFFDYEKGTAGSKKKVAGHYTDNLTDLLTGTATRAAALKGEPIGRFNRAADEALATFRASVAAYAPEWTPETAEPAKLEPKATAVKKDKSETSWSAVKAAAKQCVEDALRLATEQKWSEDESFAKRLELQTLIETMWTSATPPTTPPQSEVEAAEPVRSASHFSVLVNADSTKTAVPAAPSNGNLDRTAESYLNPGETTDLLEKTPIPIGEATHFSAVPEGRAAQLPDSPEGQAMATVEAFESVGATEFKLVLLSAVPVGGKAKAVDSADVSAAQFRQQIASYVQRSEEQSISVCLRPRDGALIQVDDCTAEVLARLRPFSFLVVETSPANYQAWLALPVTTGNPDRLAVRERLLRQLKVTGANGGAFNSVRIPGSINAKEKYKIALGSYPRVQLVSVQPGRTVTPLELERAGLLAPVEVKIKAEPPRYTSAKLPSQWPDYHELLQRKWLDAEGRPDRSSADISWSMAALRAGWPQHSVVSELDRLSDKAAGRRDDYAERTVDAAARLLAASPQQSVHFGNSQQRVRMTI